MSHDAQSVEKIIDHLSCSNSQYAQQGIAQTMSILLNPLQVDPRGEIRLFLPFATEAERQETIVSRNG